VLNDDNDVAAIAAIAAGQTLLMIGNYCISVLARALLLSGLRETSRLLI
jgi:hypothetical protein